MADASGCSVRFLKADVMQMRQPVKTCERIFVIEIEGRAIVAFEAVNMREAQSIRNEAWLREELAQRHKLHELLVPPLPHIRVRAAEGEEKIKYSSAKKMVGDTASEDLFLADLG